MPQTKNENRQLRIVIVGHVDHGKSTLVGRLIHETGSLPDGKLDAIKAMSERRGMPFEWAFLMDAIQAERDQGITIDTTQIWFHTPKRPYVIIDAPGHKEFLKNMVTGAASSEAALLLIDAARGRAGAVAPARLSAASAGRRSRWRCWSTRWTWSATRPTASARSPRSTAPICAGWASRPPASCRSPPARATTWSSTARTMPWYQGPTVLQALDAFEYKELPTERPLRVPVQDVYKFDQRRIIAGRVESGTVRVGDEVVFSPSNKTAKIKIIEAWHVPEAPELAQAGQSIGVTLTEQIFVERGEVMSHLEHAPIESNVFKARLFWLGHKPLQLGKSYTLKLGTLEAPVTVEAIEHVIDTSDLSTKGADKIERNGAGEVVLRTKRMLALDEHVQNPITGRFVLVEDYLPLGGGIISMEGYPDQRQLITVRSTNITEVGHAVTREARSGRNGHKGAVLWFTGLSGSRQVDPGPGAGARAVRQGLPGLRAGRRQYPRRAQRQSRLQPRGPGREHPPRRRGGVPVRRCRLHRDQLVHLALPLRPRAGAGRGQGRVPRGLRQGVAGGLRGPRPQGPLQARAQGRDPGIHRHQQPLRGARPRPTWWCRPTSCRSTSAWRS